MRLLFVIRALRGAMVGLACGGLLCPPGLSAAGPSQAVQTPARPVIHDVKLDAAGRLAGQVLDLAGQPQVNQKLVLLRDGKPVSECRTDAAGKFHFERLGGGLYQIGLDKAAVACRVWAERTAPPAAKPQVLLVTGDELARGQQPFSELFTNPCFCALIIAAAIAIPIAIHNSQSEPDSGS